MADPIDIFSDQFQVNIGPYGSTLNFMVSNAVPPAPGSVAQPERLATVRMSLEHLKIMAFMLREQLVEFERSQGIHVELPLRVLNNLRISKEDWESFWQPVH